MSLDGKKLFVVNELDPDHGASALQRSHVFWIVSAAKPYQYRVSAFKSAYTPQTRA